MSLETNWTALDTISMQHVSIIGQSNPTKYKTFKCVRNKSNLKVLISWHSERYFVLSIVLV